MNQKCMQFTIFFMFKLFLLNSALLVRANWFDKSPFARVSFHDSGKMGPAEFMFTTSNISAYTDVSIRGMKVRIL